MNPIHRTTIFTLEGMPSFKRALVVIATVVALASSIMLPKQKKEM